MCCFVSSEQLSIHMESKANSFLFQLSHMFIGTYESWYSYSSLAVLDQGREEEGAPLIREAIPFLALPAQIPRFTPAKRYGGFTLRNTIQGSMAVM